MFDEEPKDMFAETDTVAPKVPPVPEPSAAPALIAPPPTQLPPTYGAMPLGGQASPAEPHRGETVKIVLIVAVVLVVLGISAFFAYRIMVQQPEAESIVDSVPDTGVTAGADDDEDTVEPEPESTPVETTNPATLLDSDGDGLTNARELDLRTSVTNPDTDGDGLGDREEVEVYGTDPLNPDTDGDGFLDGAEVSAGYNPNGEGRLFVIPTSN